MYNSNPTTNLDTLNKKGSVIRLLVCLAYFWALPDNSEHPKDSVEHHLIIVVVVAASHLQGSMPAASFWLAVRPTLNPTVPNVFLPNSVGTFVGLVP